MQGFFDYSWETLAAPLHNLQGEQLWLYLYGTIEVGNTGHIITFSVFKIISSNFSPRFFAGKSVPIILLLMSVLMNKGQAWEVNIFLKRSAGRCYTWFV